MLLRFGRVLMLIALLAATGAQWAVLQTVAWAGMFAQNLESCSPAAALSNTLDGRHACPICRAIAASKQAEHSEFTASNARFEFPPSPASLTLAAPAAFQLLPQTDHFAELISSEPPTPPPRGLFA